MPPDFRTPSAFVLGRRGDALARRRARLELAEEAPRDLGDLVDGSLERGLVRLRRLAVAADLPHELERRRPGLVLVGGRLDVVERLDRSAHGFSLRFAGSVATRRARRQPTPPPPRAPGARGGAPWSRREASPRTRSGAPRRRRTSPPPA